MEVYINLVWFSTPCLDHVQLHGLFELTNWFLPWVISSRNIFAHGNWVFRNWKLKTLLRTHTHTHTHTHIHIWKGGKRPHKRKGQLPWRTKSNSKDFNCKNKHQRFQRAAIGVQVSQLQSRWNVVEVLLVWQYCASTQRFCATTADNSVC